MAIIGAYKYFAQMMDSKLSGVHTTYLAKVLSINGRTAKIQPLGLNKNPDGTTSKQSVLSNVPISKHIRLSDPQNPDCICCIPKLSVGDIAVCVCCEQNISEAKRGVNALPPVGRFNMSDSIIIGFI